MACSRPAPGPFTFTSISTIPCLRASLAAFSAARPAAKGVLLRAPLKPTVPADAQAIVSPFVSVIVTIVLLNVALMCATPRVTPLRIFFFAPAFAPAAGFAVVSAMDLSVVSCQLSVVSCYRSPRTTDNRLLPEFLHALLAGDGLARAFARPGVG